jgi:hypothetical protein
MGKNFSSGSDKSLLDFAESGEHIGEQIAGVEDVFIELSPVTYNLGT